MKSAEVADHLEVSTLARMAEATAQARADRTGALLFVAGRLFVDVPKMDTAIAELGRQVGAAARQRQPDRLTRHGTPGDPAWASGRSEGLLDYLRRLRLATQLPLSCEIT
jgi:hypothetical protein